MDASHETWDDTWEEGLPRPVSSNQEGLHPRLCQVVIRHLGTPSLRPPPSHTLAAFAQAQAWVFSRTCPVVLDSGCGTGESTLALARRFPQCSILGLDKSEARLQKAKARPQPPNVLYLRAELVDFWPLVAKAGWDIRYHALYYPNPWPKAAHLKRRFHGDPVFPVLLDLSPELELRSNWLLYLQEFSKAAELARGLLAEPRLLDIAEPVSAFERKYAGAGQQLWALTLQRP